MFISRRRAILLRLSDEPKPHLWIVLTDPEGSPPQVAVVPLRTKRHHSDTTVVLNAGDHPFITHETVVHYSDLCIVRVATLVKRIADGNGSLEPDIDEEVFARICDGVERSPFTVNAFRDYCAKRFAIASP